MKLETHDKALMNLILTSMVCQWQINTCTINAEGPWACSSPDLTIACTASSCSVATDVILAVGTLLAAADNQQLESTSAMNPDLGCECRP